MANIMNFIKYCLATTAVLSTVVSAYPQHISSCDFHLRQENRIDSLLKNQFIQKTYIAAPFIISGIALYSPGKRYQDLRTEFAPKFTNRMDDYIQYTPTMMLYGMRIAGIEGKSSWKRLLVTHAFSAVTMTAITNGVKYSVREPRPNGKGRESYPSGHTALAFMSATMVHHEYGLTLSPWYSVGAYSLATATAVSRVLNNRHYLHDVLLGAGIGILSTELGYMFSNIIFKEKGLLMSDKDYGTLDINKPTSYLGLVVGFNKILNTLPTDNGVRMRCHWGSSAGVEGVFYLDRNWALNTVASTYTVKTSIDRGRFEIDGPPLSWYNIGIGPQYSAPITRSCRIGTKLTAGYSRLLERELHDYLISSSNGLNLTWGLFVEKYVTQGMTIKLHTNLEKTLFDNNRFNLINIASGASINLDLGILRN